MLTLLLPTVMRSLLYMLIVCMIVFVNAKCTKSRVTFCRGRVRGSPEDKPWRIMYDIRTTNIAT